MAYKTIQVKTEGRVGVITFSRPESLNALCDELTTELAAALAVFEKDAGIGCVVLTGSKKAFAAGADIKELQSRDFVGLYMHDPFAETWEAVARFRKPIIAAVSGYALGGGCEIAMMCDFIIASKTAKFGLKLPRGGPEVVAVTDRDRAKRIDGHQRAHCQPVVQHGRGRAEPALQGAGGRAIARPRRAEGEIRPRLLHGSAPQPFVGICPPGFVAAVQQIKQDRAGHDRHPRCAHRKPAPGFGQKISNPRPGIQPEGRAT